LRTINLDPSTSYVLKQGYGITRIVRWVVSIFSIPPSILRSPHKQKRVRHLPLQCLIVETDSPVLGPESGARKEPANLTLSIRAIAEIKHISGTLVVEAVVANTRKL
jgi:TatD DNase family protein